MRGSPGARPTSRDIPASNVARTDRSWPPSGAGGTIPPSLAAHWRATVVEEGTALIAEPKSSWTEVADRLLTWGMVITIPLIGVFGFGLLTTVKHPPPGPTAGVSGSVLAAPEVTDQRPSVELKHAIVGPCATPAATPAGPCVRPAPVTAGSLH